MCYILGSDHASRRNSPSDRHTLSPERQYSRPANTDVFHEFIF